MLCLGQVWFPKSTECQKGSRGWCPPHSRWEIMGEEIICSSGRLELQEIILRLCTGCDLIQAQAAGMPTDVKLKGSEHCHCSGCSFNALLIYLNPTQPITPNQNQQKLQLVFIRILLYSHPAGQHTTSASDSQLTRLNYTLQSAIHSSLNETNLHTTSSLMHTPSLCIL